MSEEQVLVTEDRGAVRILRLNRPEARNALNPALIDALGLALLDAEQDVGIRAVVITGTGDRAFCAGMDLRSFAEGNSISASPEGMAGFGRFVSGDIGVPIVGAAQATAVAGGLEVLLGCDVIVIGEGAKVGLPEVKRGLFAAGGGIFLGTRIPLALALELTLTGDTIDASRAAAIGMVNAVVPADQVLDVAIEYATRIAANGPLGLKATKQLVRLAVSDMAAARKRQGELQSEVFGSEDAKEGALAFVEKRDPVWRGR